MHNQPVPVILRLDMRHAISQQIRNVHTFVQWEKPNLYSVARASFPRLNPSTIPHSMHDTNFNQ
eukprot:2020538-Pleurochrysis_carterae.AAC.2